MSHASRHPRVDVFCVGYACVDLNFRTAHHPGPDEKLRATGMHTCGGGPAANAAVTVVRLGGTARFGGYLGKDAFGNAHLREFAEDGVLAEPVVRGGTHTPVAAVTIKPNGERSIVDFRTTSAVETEHSATLAEYPARVLLLDGHQPLLSVALADEARALGVPVVLDAGSVHDGTLMLLNKVDYLIASEKFARSYGEDSDPRMALASMDGLAPFIAATWGADGVYWQDAEGQHHMPAFDVEAVDTTGAGDAFHGAFALGLVQNMPLRANLRRACATGALTCLTAGARTALPDRVRVEALVRAGAPSSGLDAPLGR